MGVNVDRTMRALKILVGVLGVLLVAGTVALVTVVVGRIRHGPVTAAGVERGSPVRTSLPPGSHIIATELSGDRLLVRLALADGGEALVLFNARSGAEVAVIGIGAAAADARR
jgi:hypothetical protein